MDILAIFVRNIFTFSLLLILTTFSWNITTILFWFWIATWIRYIFTFLIRFSFDLLYFLTFCLPLNYQKKHFKKVILNDYNLLYLPNQNTCWYVESKLSHLPHLFAILVDILRHIYHCIQCPHMVILYKLCNTWSLTRIGIFQHTLFHIPFLALVNTLVQKWSCNHFCKNCLIPSIWPIVNDHK